MTIQQFEDDRRRLRKEVLIRRVLDSLRSTIQLRAKMPEINLNDVYPDFTDASAQVVGQLVEAVEILEEIILASDGCHDHKDCRHSMEPWKRARALLRGKWDADVGERKTWPSSGSE